MWRQGAEQSITKTDRLLIDIVVAAGAPREAPTDRARGVLLPQETSSLSVVFAEKKKWPPHIQKLVAFLVSC